MTGAHLTGTLSEARFQIPQQTGQTAFQRAFRTDKTLYEYYHAVDPERGQRFASAMAGHYNTPLDDPVESIYPFEKVREDALIVDIGGGRGQHSIRLAEQYPKITFLVQDQTNVVEPMQSADLPESVTGRVKWQVHNLYSPQPVQGADVYVLSHVLMDNQSSTCADILRHTAKAMRPGRSRILIHDFVDPERGESASRLLNELDFHMLASLNCVSKPLAVWKEILHKADPRLQVKAIYQGSKNAAVFEVTLAGS
ncbi:hypothetical protein ASPACDRAFT_1883308 [Aspergillus aculeatus ATCC 16872]|uniref:O-methyltransferase C-terminal domain-containing protein n=1 Tax=Aspergillus aculeatus (strain ATCC 16872 / CBS 172.66 / WB 5094) TaxID=690307 RepID=A0A1L9WHP5_ASPA1|nr:uncharacterized protein ASPACDRAFT_1883308 [Aspergillus aculeatus ATCC 16872]OJJ95673.1 hypothetical protein ASPACDRAFT_1883308 [Aspergillus aculeatus ATCC 16872]